MSRHTLVIVCIWVALASVVYYLVDRIQQPNTLQALGHDHTVVLKRGLDGHYRAEALINGEQVDVLVDTGATGVAISQTVADKLQLKSLTAVRTNTANGTTVGYMVRLSSVKLGGVEANNVSAMIAPGLEGDVLLGMSFLARMDVRLFKGEMTIRQVE
ncbi:TIGR02281 family clan AA aspartic protease [Methylotenera sp. 1P/1]|uniref:retropepsin-like aspartic protease family protein n=1 Tax=Methylotenera sp. 1P/1 TaxID=1131551 RepID=UPI00036721F7|nr:retropepsin-like aspartic protease [Methylotenera sp. 1P/1]